MAPPKQARPLVVPLPTPKDQAGPPPQKLVELEVVAATGVVAASPAAGPKAPAAISRVVQPEEVHTHVPVFLVCDLDLEVFHVAL